MVYELLRRVGLTAPKRVIRRVGRDPASTRDELAGHRDATLVSVLACAGPRPFDARALTLDASGSAPWSLEKAKLNRPRSIDLFQPIRRDLLEYLIARGRPAAARSCSPDVNGWPWRKDTWDNGRART